MKFLTEDDKKNMRLEYELLKRYILERYRRVYFAASIIIPASLLAIIECFKYGEEGMSKTMTFLHIPIGVVILCFVLVMLIALFLLHRLGLRITRVEYDVINEIIKSLGEEGFPMWQAYKERLKGDLWSKIRKHIWDGLILFFIFVDLWALITFLYW